MNIRRQSARPLAVRILAVAAAAAIGVFVSTAGAAPVNLVQNASLENGSGNTPTCWLLGGYGTNRYSWSRTSDAHSGQYGETLRISSYTNGDRKLLTAFSNACSPAVTAGHTYTVTAWYKSTAAGALFAFTRPAGSSGYSWWAQKAVPASSSWTQVSWTTAPVPSGIANLSVGLGLQRAGTMVMDDFTLVDNQAATTTTTTTNTTPPPDTTPPRVSLTAPTSATGTIAVTASASDNVSVARVDLLVDGTTVATDSAAPYTFNWDSATVSNGVHTLSARAVDSAGLSTVSVGVSVNVQNTAAPSPPPPPSTSGTLPSGAAGLPRADATCASQVTLSTWEPVPANSTANNTVPASPSAVPWSNVGIPPSFTKWYAKRTLVTGNYKGTTDEIIQWAACKWGINPDLMRAVAVQESDWKMSEVGDYCGTPGEGSYGLFQVKNAMCDGTGAWGGYPYTANDTGLNADFYAAQFRACLDGDFHGWLYGNQTAAQIVSSKGFDNLVWGCVGAWFSGAWYDAGASSYIANVQKILANRTWLTGP
jgi:hypothetical protein